MKYKNKRKCHVRYNKKSRHPTAIIGEDKYNFIFKGLSHENYLISEYHSRIYYWQSKHNVIMPKKLRKKYYEKYVFKKSQ